MRFACSVLLLYTLRDAGSQWAQLWWLLLPGRRPVGSLVQTRSVMSCPAALAHSLMACCRCPGLVWFVDLVWPGVLQACQGVSTEWCCAVPLPSGARVLELQ